MGHNSPSLAQGWPQLTRFRSTHRARSARGPKSRPRVAWPCLKHLWLFLGLSLTRPDGPDNSMSTPLGEGKERPPYRSGNGPSHSWIFVFPHGPGHSWTMRCPVLDLCVPFSPKVKLVKESLTWIIRRTPFRVAEIPCKCSRPRVSTSGGIVPAAPHLLCVAVGPRTAPGVANLGPECCAR